MSTKILIVSRHSPYGSSLAREALDVLLATSTYDQDLSVLFMDDGVFQLLKDQQSYLIEQKSFSAMLAVLPLYGIDNIFIHAESLDKRKIKISDLAIDDPKLINNKQVGELFELQDQLLSF
jgi:tRNA 2-thiouridine synthesizing protein C